MWPTPGILKDGDAASTEYLDKSSRTARQKFHARSIKQATDEVGLDQTIQRQWLATAGLIRRA